MAGTYGPFPLTLSYAARVEFGIDFYEQLDTENGETITAVSVVWPDGDLSDSSPRISNSMVLDWKGANRGTPGSKYRAQFSATTSTGRVLGGEQIGEVVIRIADTDGV